jgi:hypothetical protein
LRPKGHRECLASEGWQPGARDAHGLMTKKFPRVAFRVVPEDASLV